MNGYLIIILAIGVLFILKEIVRLKKKNKKSRKPSHFKDNQNNYKSRGLHNLYNHEYFKDSSLRYAVVKSLDYKVKTILNKGEYYCERAINEQLKKQKENYHLFCQVPIIAYISDTTTKKNLQGMQGSLRPDFTITDPKGIPILVIEIDGARHYEPNDDLLSLFMSKINIPLLRINSVDEWKDKQDYFQYMKGLTKEALDLFFTHYPDNINSLYDIKHERIVFSGKKTEEND